MIVGVGDVLELDGALDIFQLPRIRRVLLRRFVHDLHKALKAADAVLELLHEAD